MTGTTLLPKLYMAITFAVTVAYIFADVTAMEWMDFLKWAFGIYAASEIGAKGASAYATKQ